jgi:cyclic pyranopterin phosphate synthase
LAAKPKSLRFADVIRCNVHAKWEGREINTSRFIKPLRTMHAIGG